MANSFTFNSFNLKDYDLVIISSNPHILNQLISYVQLKDKAYSSGVKWEPRTINLDIAILGDDITDVNSNLDNIKKILVTEDDCQLVLDILPGRYFNAQLRSIDGQYTSQESWQGSLSFICTDPLGYGANQISSDYSINADPKTITWTAGGTGFINPVYTLTAGGNLTDVTIKVKNLNTDEEIQWTGSLTTGQQLVIDVPNWIIKKGGVVSMSSVSGQFPRLQPGANSVRVTGFGTTGVLNILYRNTYL